jgi:hypothetical protein
MGFDGFVEKYYQDELKQNSGYIPLHKNIIPQETLEYVVSGEKNMKACLIEIDLTKIKGITKNQQNKEIEITPKIDDDFLLLLAPLPLSCVKKIIFKTNEDKKEIEKDQKLHNNFILTDLNLQHNKTDQKLFDNKKTGSKSGGFWSNEQQHNKEKSPNTVIDESREKIDYKKIYAFGGMLANLFYFAKNGEQSHQKFTDFQNTGASDSGNKDIQSIYNYFYKIQNNDNFQEIYNKIIDNIINGSDFKNNIVSLLESQEWGVDFQQRAKELAQKLRDFEKNDTTISQKFSQAEKQLEKGLLMLFHREDSRGLMKYQLDIFNEDDYLLFAMLFGIRDGFFKMPKFLRQYQNLQNFISCKMAEYAHHSINSKVEFMPPTLPKTIWQLLKNQKIIKKIISDLGLKQCVRTIMSGDFKHEKGKNIYEGFIEPKYDIIDKEYFTIMSKENIDTEKYNKFANFK